MSKIPKTEIGELEFDQIKENFKSYIQTTEFKDHDFEASGLSFLVDLLAYNTHYNAYYLNQLAGEMFLDTAQQRKNVVSISKQMGYLSNSKKASKAKVELSIDQRYSGVNIINLNAGTEFIGRKSEGGSFLFVSTEDCNFTRATGFKAEVDLIQGRYVSQKITVNQLKFELDFVVSSKDVDIDTLSVFIRESENSEVRTKYERVIDITSLSKDSLVYFIEENYDGYYKVIFGDGVIGKPIENNNVIEMSYLVTDGFQGNDCVTFDIIPSEDASESPVKPAVSSVLRESSGGSEREDTEEIRRNARKMFFSQNRTVTENDYSIILKKSFPDLVDTVSVWGGEKNEIPRFGSVYCAIKPRGNQFLSVEEKKSLTDFLNNLNIISIVPEIVDPDYVYIRLNIDIDYDVENIESSENEFKKEVRSNVIDFARENLFRFNNSFQITSLSRRIDRLNPYFIGTNTRTTVYQLKKIVTNSSNSFKVDFNNKIKSKSLITRPFRYAKMTQYCYICESSENSIDGNNVFILKVCYEGDGGSLIPLKDRDGNDYNVGTINHSNGLIKVEDFSPTYIIGDSSDLYFEVEIDGKFVHPTRNQILFVRGESEEDVTISATPIITSR